MGTKSGRNRKKTKDVGTAAARNRTIAKPLDLKRRGHACTSPLSDPIDINKTMTPTRENKKKN